MHKFTKTKLPATFNQFFTAVTKLQLCCVRNSTKPNQYFIPFFYTFRILSALNFGVQRFGTPSLMT